MEHDDTETDCFRDESREKVDISRRTVLSSLGAGAATLALGSAAGTAAADEPGDSPAASFAEEMSDATSATSSGAWSDASVWDSGLPGAAADARIGPDASVTIEGETEPIKTLVVEGDLAFATATDTHLRAETIITMPGSSLEIGTEDEPIQPDAEARITFVHHEDISEKDYDPERVSKGLITMGDLAIHGGEKTTWDELAAAPTAGDTTVELASAPTNWNEGDEIVIPGLDPTTDRDEERSIASVSGSTVTLDSALNYDHSPPDHGGTEPLSAYTLNLSRTVVFESERQASDPTNEQRVNRQGHVMIMSTNTAVHNARFVHVGRTNKRYYFTNGKYGAVPDSGRFVPDEPNPRKRYALHYHETGIEDSASHEASGLVVQDSPGWGVVNHHSNAAVSNSATYRVLGAGFVTEGGDERGSFVGNFALRSRGSGQKIDERQAPRESAAAINDFGHAGHGFWLQGPAVTVEDNVAAGHRAYAFSLWNRPLYDEAEFSVDDFRTHRGETANFPLEYAEDAGLLPDAMEQQLSGGELTDSRVSTSHLNFTVFADNTAFASAGGLDIANHNFDNSHGDESEYSRIEGFTAYNIAPWTDIDGSSELHRFSGGNTWGEGGYVGISLRYSHNVRIVDATLVNDGGGWGVRRNFYPASGAVVDSHIEGFDTGIHTIDTGTGHIEGVTFDNESVNVDVKPIGNKEGYAIDMANLTFDGGKENVTLAYRPGAFLPQKFAWGERHHGAAHSYDGRRLYYDAQARDSVPFETTGDVEAVYTDQAYNWSTVGPFDGIEDAKSKVVGKSNEQLKDEYGLCIYDELMPAAAVSHPDITGAKIEPADDATQAPTASFDHEVTTDLTLRFDASASNDPDGSISSYEWDFGDGTTATGKTVEHTYDAADEYDVTLTVTDDADTTGETTNTVAAGETHKILIDGLDGQETTYEFSVSGTLEKGEYATEEDTVAGRTASGRIGRGQDSYRYVGEITSWSLETEIPVKITIDGEEVDPSTLGQPDDDGDADETVTVAPGGEHTFTPADLTVEPGTTVAFEWASGGHTVTVDSQPEEANWAGVDSTQRGGYTLTHTFEVEGTYEYYCRPHQSHMQGTITVTDEESQSAYGRDSPWPLPGRVQAEYFDTGGPDVAFADESTGNIGGEYRDTQVDIQAMPNSEDNHNLGWMHEGEWLEYTVYVRSGGTYDLTLNVASPQSGTVELAVSIGDTDVGPVTIPQTGDWNNYETVTVSGIQLAAGEQVLRIDVANTGGHEYGCDIDWFEVTENDQESVPQAIDADDDGTIEDEEILDALTHWQSGEPVPNTGGQTVTDETVLKLVKMWKAGTDVMDGDQ